mmetsp:Transcript_79229/g.199084  ORF Transcript_79229/g.199084 Transcript_79229/m.199084 type:complete len:208 (+) Transcript_79229:660-1283(+)
MGWLISWANCCCSLRDISWNCRIGHGWLPLTMLTAHREPFWRPQQRHQAASGSSRVPSPRRNGSVFVNFGSWRCSRPCRHSIFRLAHSFSFTAERSRSSMSRRMIPSTTSALSMLTVILGCISVALHPSMLEALSMLAAAAVATDVVKVADCSTRRLELGVDLQIPSWRHLLWVCSQAWKAMPPMRWRRLPRARPWVGHWLILASWF